MLDERHHFLSRLIECNFIRCFAFTIKNFVNEILKLIWDYLSFPKPSELREHKEIKNAHRSDFPQQPETIIDKKWLCAYSSPGHHLFFSDDHVNFLSSWGDKLVWICSRNVFRSSSVVKYKLTCYLQLDYLQKDKPPLNLKSLW